MKKFVALLTNEKRLRMDGKTMTPTFSELYRVYIKELDQFFFHTYSLTCLNKDTFGYVIDVPPLINFSIFLHLRHSYSNPPPSHINGNVSNPDKLFETIYLC